MCSSEARREREGAFHKDKIVLGKVTGTANKVNMTRTDRVREDMKEVKVKCV